MEVVEHPELRETIRDDFAICVWIEDNLVAVSARPLRRPDSQIIDRPALPSRSRLLVWGGRQGLIRERLRPHNRWTRLVAALSKRRSLTHDQQIERLTDELLAAIAVFDPSGQASWAAPGDRLILSSVSTGRLRSSGRLPDIGGRALGLLVAAGLIGTVAVGAVLLGVGSGGETSAANGQPTITTEMPEADGPTPDEGGQIAEEPDAPAPTPRSAPQAITTEPLASVSSAAEELALKEIVDQVAEHVASKDDGRAEYVVTTGDSLGAIATRLDVDLDELLVANNLDGESVIIPGQVLRLP